MIDPRETPEGLEDPRNDPARGNITDEVERDTGSAGPSYVNPDGADEGGPTNFEDLAQENQGQEDFANSVVSYAMLGSGNPDKEWQDQNRRQNALHIATAAARSSGRPVSVSQLVADARELDKFLKGE